MVSFKSLLVICSAVLSVLATPAEPILIRRFSSNETSDLVPRSTITAGATGTSSGYYYSLWIQANTGATMNIGTGQYSLSWTTAAQNIVGGLGWMPGAARNIAYSGTFTPGGNSYLSVYGWTTGPLVEYYILESYGTYNPGGAATHKGTVVSDGATYDIYTDVRTNEPSIQGTATFNQYWSIRQSKRVGGTVTTANHFNAWKSLGLAMGTFNYQILATEGYQSAGSSSITISDAGTSGSSGSGTGTGTGTTASAPPPPSSTSSSQAQHWAQCGGTGWTGATTCAAPYTCTYSSAYYSQCL